MDLFDENYFGGSACLQASVMFFPGVWVNTGDVGDVIKDVLLVLIVSIIVAVWSHSSSGLPTMAHTHQAQLVVVIQSN